MINLMVINNSQCQVYLAVLRGIYLDMVSANIRQSEVKRDFLEIRRRTCQEGIGFLTKTLPSLGKSIDRSLASGSNLRFSGFKRNPGTQLPAFGRQLFRLLFNDDGSPIQAKDRELPTRCETIESPTKETASSNTGDPSREAMIMALKALRQICYCFYKLNIPYHENQNKKVLNEFVETDRSLPRITARFGDGQTQAVIKQARRLISRVLCNACPLSGIPKHGPGAVSTGELSPEKHLFSRLYKRLESVYKIDHWFYLNTSHLAEDFEHLQSLQPLKAGCAKVVLVPKDSRGPRLISCEPLEYQWIQQSQMTTLVDVIESHPLTKGHVNFRDQSVNGRLALEGSTGSYPWVTLDMKEASDRVSLRLVYSLFPSNWFAALYASRSSHTLLPDGTKVRMKKFAPMGSAVCFPVEAIVFWALSVSALMIYKHMQLRKAAANVFVYGDDIVLSTEDHSIVYQCLEAVGLKVNADKCCTAGPFKESCGVDAFHGVPVTPLKMRKPWSSAPKPSILASWVAFSNAAWDRGMFVTAKTVEEWCQNLFSSRIPTVSDRNPSVISFIRPQLYTAPRTQPAVAYRFNKRLQRGEYRGIALRPTLLKAKVTGYPLLLRLLAEKERKKTDVSSIFLESDGGAVETGYFAIAHREKPTSAWTAAR